MNSEQIRLEEARTNKVLWKKWGPYLSERQWGTVREDYSQDGEAWSYFPHSRFRVRPDDVEKGSPPCFLIHLSASNK